jgi:hypothetical protein
MIPRRAYPEEYADLATAHYGRYEIDWAPHADGEWWLVHDGPESMPKADRLRAFERVKKTSGRWARKYGYTREIRRRENGRQIWVRFTRAVQ